MSRSSTTQSDFRAGLLIPLRALSLIRQERRLQRWAVAPVLVNIAALALGFGFLVAEAATYWQVASTWWSLPEATLWYTWIWVGPLWLLAGAARLLFWLFLSGLTVLAALLIAAVLVAPIHEALAAATERVAGAIPETESRGWTGSLWLNLRMVGVQGLRLAIFFALQASVLALGLVPVAGIAAPALAFGLAVGFLAVEYTSWPMDRRGWSMTRRWAWLKQHRAAAIGFGLTATLMMMVPLANLIAMPVLVVAGTLLYLETAPPPSPS